MAQISHSSRTGIFAFRTRTGSPRILSPDASTAASTALIQAGQVVEYDGGASSAAHRIVRASTVAGHPVLAANICGIAAAPDTSDGSTSGLADGKRRISVWAADGQTEFLFPSKISAVASTLVGTALALGWDSTLNFHYLTANSTAGDRRVWVTEVQNPGDSNGYLWGRFTSSAVSPAVAIL